MWSGYWFKIYSGIFLLLIISQIIEVQAQCLKVNVGVILDKNANPCNGPIILDAHYPGYNYSWSTGETTQKITVVQSDTYIVVVDNGSGCSGTDTVTVSFLKNPTLDLGPDPSPQCGGCINFDAGAGSGFSYLWSTGETTEKIKYCQTGTHAVSVKLTNDVGCTVSDTVNVTITPGIHVDLGPDISTCDSQITINSNLTGYHYDWNTGDTTASIVTRLSGTYYLDVHDNSGCVGNDTVNVDFLPVPVVNLGSDPTPQCGGCITLDAGSGTGYTYLWSSGDDSSKINFCATGAEKVWVRITNSSGCVASDTINVNIKALPSVNLGPDINTCNSKVILNPHYNGGTYHWSSGSNLDSLTVTQSGSYFVDVTASNGCSQSDTVNVSFLPSPTVDLGPDPAPKCGGCVTLDAGDMSGVTYLWSTGETDSKIKFCQDGDHKISVVATNTNGCTASDTIDVNILNGYNNSSQNDTIVCQGPLEITAPSYPGASYLWKTGETGPSISVNDPGSYIVYISDISGCNANDTIADTVHVAMEYGLLAPDEILDQSTCHEKKFTATHVDGATSYIWTVPSGATITSGQGTSTITVSASENLTGNISVVASNNIPACQSLSTVIPVNIGDHLLNIPNAFSPNSDNINDTWVIRNIHLYPENELIILNRWGNEVFRSKQYHNQWDGSDLNDGSYFYKLIINACDEEKVITGYITIVR